MIVEAAFAAAFVWGTPRTASSQLLSAHPKRHQLLVGQETVFVGVEPVEQGRGIGREEVPREARVFCVDARRINEVFAAQPLWRKGAGERGRQWKKD
jgi:hypothetical protein